QIVRPAMTTGDAPRMTIGQGSTLVTWNAAGIAVQVQGPDSMPLNGTATFRINVFNQGDIPLRDVVVSDALPPGFKYLASNPSGQLFGDHVEWRIGDLAPRTGRPIEVTLQALRAGDVRYCARARAADGIEGEGCVDRLRVFAPALQLTVSGPQRADVGADVQFQIEISNRSTSPLTNIQLVDRFDAGLVHAQGQRSPMGWPIGDLAAGETKRVALTFNIQQPGTLCHVVEATADGGHATQQRACVIASTPPAGAAPQANSPFRVQLNGPTRVGVDQPGVYRFSVVNLSPAAINNVQVTFEFPGSIKPVRASQYNGFQAQRGRIVWTFAQLFQNDRREFEVEAQYLQADPAAVLRVVAAAAGVAPQMSEASTEVTAAGVAAPPPPGAGDPGEVPNGPVVGDLSLTVAPVKEVVQVGQPVKFVVLVKNDRNASDRNVVLTIVLPEGINAEQVKVTNFRARGLAADGRTLEMMPIAELRAGEALRSCEVNLVANTPGRMLLRAEVRSWRTTAPLVAEAEVTVQ
ncbi:MAG TPA: hypothetical protein PLV92_18415, partial [Pirellulaceae bacterium]|nr:hypothetical protein [Pirellulaceae bacterium]